MGVFRILVTSAGGTLSALAITMLKASQRHRVEVVAVDMSPDVPARHAADVFETVPAGNDPAYAGRIAELVRRHGVDLVLPWSDEEALALSAAADTVTAAGAKLACVDHALLRIMSNKAATFALLAERGVPVAQWREVTSHAELDAVLADFVARFGEAAVKPEVSRGGRNVYVIRRDIAGAHPFNGGRELHADHATFCADHLASVPLPALVTERLFEPVYDIDVLAWQGMPLRVVPRRRFNPAGIPFTGNEVVAAPELVALGRQVVEAVGLSWLYDIDVMTGADGLPRVIELNPRPSGSLAAVAACGVPIFDDLISLAKGEPLPDIAIPHGARVVPYTSLWTLS